MLERCNRLESLEQLSLTALYEDIVAQLLPTSDSSLIACVNNKRSSLFSVLPHCNPVYHFATAEDKATNAILQIKVVDSIRQKLCLPPFRRVRSQLVEEYCKHQQQQHIYTSASGYSKKRRPDIHLFLDWWVSLNKSPIFQIFKNLELYLFQFFSAFWMKIWLLLSWTLPCFHQLKCTHMLCQDSVQQNSWARLLIGAHT